MQVSDAKVNYIDINKLSGFFIFFILFNVSLEFLGINTGLINLCKWAIFTPGTWDSWHPMMTAIEHLYTNPDVLVYNKLFFNDHVKFQYPLTSLLPLDLINVLFTHERAVFLLEIASWLAVPMTALMSVMSFNLLLKKNVLKDNNQLIILAVIFLSVLFYYPILKAYTLGQVQVFINFYFATACFFWICNRKAISGIFIGLMCVIKPHFLLFLIWGGLRSQWRFVTGIIIVVLVFATISGLVYGVENNINYINVIMYMSKHGEAFYANQSLNGLLNRMFFNGNNLVWLQDSFAPFNPIIYVITVIASISFISFSLFCGLRLFKNNMLLDLVIAGMIFTISAPIAWEHHYGIFPQLLVVLFAYLLNDHDLYSKKYFIILAIIYTLSAGFYPFINVTANTMFNFTQSYLFISGISAIVLGYIINRKSTIAASL